MLLCFFSCLFGFPAFAEKEHSEKQQTCSPKTNRPKTAPEGTVVTGESKSGGIHGVGVGEKIGEFFEGTAHQIQRV